MVRFHKITCTFIYILTLLLILTTSCAIPTSKSNTTTLRILTPTWIYDKFNLKTVADEFMKENPGVKVVMDQYSNYDTSFYPLMNKTNNNRYDICLGFSREHIVQYAYSGTIMDFDNGFFDSVLQKEDFFPSFLELGNINGRQYMIPLMGEIMCLVVRTDLLREAGLSNSYGRLVPPSNWNELYQYAAKLTSVNEEGKKIYGLNIDFGKNMLIYSFYSSLQARKGTIFDNKSTTLDMSSNDMKDILQMWQLLVKNGYSPTYTFEDLDAGRENFKKGTVAMLLTPHSRWIEGSAAVGEKNVSIMPLPGAEKNGSLTYIHGITIPSSSQNKDLAIKFIKQKLLSRGCQSQAMQSYGKIPSLIRNYDVGLSDEWNTIFNWTRNATTLPIYRDWSKIDRVLQVEIQNCVTGKQSAEQASNNMLKQLSDSKKSIGF